MQVSQGGKLPNTLGSLKPGDTVTVVTYAGTNIQLKVVSIDSRTLTGQSNEGSISIPVVQIKSVAKSHFSVGKSIGLVAGVAYAALAVLGVWAFYSLGKATK